MPNQGLPARLYLMCLSEILKDLCDKDFLSQMTYFEEFIVELYLGHRPFSHLRNNLWNTLLDSQNWMLFSLGIANISYSLTAILAMRMI